MKLSFLFSWCNFWIGFFWDSKKKWLYFFYFPMCGVIFKFYKGKGQYKRTGFYDKKGKMIVEGDIIIADGYGSIEEMNNEGYVHCVVFDEYEQCFGSDIYKDFDPLQRYNTIEVIGHCEDMRNRYENGDWQGNLGAALK